MKRLLVAAAAVSMAASPVVAQTSIPSDQDQVELNEQDRVVTLGIFAAIAALIGYAVYEIASDDDTRQPISPG